MACGGGGRRTAASGGKVLPQVFGRQQGRRGRVRALARWPVHEGSGGGGNTGGGGGGEYAARRRRQRRMGIRNDGGKPRPDAARRYQ